MTGRCQAHVTLNDCADVPDTPGHGLRYLVSCPSCVTRSVAAAAHSGEVWRGIGEWYCADYATAQALAAKHNGAVSPQVSRTASIRNDSWYERDRE